MKELMNRINQFRDERDWRKFHNEKDLAISISLEASELLELFQWKKSEEVVEKSLQEIREELADVFIYSFMMADNLNLDVEEIIKSKLDLNEQKYPVEKSRGSNKKYNELQWWKMDIELYFEDKSFIEQNFELKEFNLISTSYIKDYPILYILYRDKSEAYIGQTTNARNRMKNQMCIRDRK